MLVSVHVHARCSCGRECVMGVLGVVSQCAECHSCVTVETVCSYTRCTCPDHVSAVSQSANICVSVVSVSMSCSISVLPQGVMRLCHHGVP